MKKYTLTMAASALGATAWFAIPAYAGDDCLGLSIGPGCIGIDGDNNHHYRRGTAIPPHARRYVNPNGGTYYYNDDTYYYEENE